MNRSQASSTRTLGRSSGETMATRAGRRAIRALLEQIERGGLDWIERGETVRFGARDGEADARVTIHDARAYARLLSRGSVGAGEAFALGWWSSPDPAAVVRLLLRNGGADGLDGGATRLRGLVDTILRPLRDNTRRGSCRNIRAHYDLGNDFFAEFLDPSMTYSCDLFDSDESTMADASEAKLDLICRKLELDEHSHVVEIGTGWGSFALHAVTRYGCRVTTTTISPSQHEAARERIDRAGLADRITLLQADYRDLPELTGRRFSHLVSIEMIEAVGHRYLERYFSTCARLLDDDGKMVIQAILIDDRKQRAHRRRPDFIMQHIFPGACLPSVETIGRAVARASDLTIRHLHDITPHYARTLRAWRQRLLQNRTRILELGYPADLVRLWEFYLAYCEAGFAERYIGDGQFFMTRPAARTDHGLDGGWARS